MRVVGGGLEYVGVHGLVRVGGCIWVGGCVWVWVGMGRYVWVWLVRVKLSWCGCGWVCMLYDVDGCVTIPIYEAAKVLVGVHVNKIIMLLNRKAKMKLLL